MNIWSGGREGNMIARNKCCVLESFIAPCLCFYLASWNGNISQPQHTVLGGHAVSVDDQFADPAIVSGCLSSTETSSSPPGVQPHWLKSIQQLTEFESSPVKQPSLTSQQLSHSMPNMPSMYNRQPATANISRMPFAQNIQHISQSVGQCCYCT